MSPPWRFREWLSFLLDSILGQWGLSMLIVASTGIIAVFAAPAASQAFGYWIVGITIFIIFVFGLLASNRAYRASQTVHISVTVDEAYRSASIWKIENSLAKIVPLRISVINSGSLPAMHVSVMVESKSTSATIIDSHECANLIMQADLPAILRSGWTPPAQLRFDRYWTEVKEGCARFTIESLPHKIPNPLPVIFLKMEKSFNDSQINLKFHIHAHNVPEIIEEESSISLVYKTPTDSTEEFFAQSSKQEDLRQEIDRAE